MNDPIADLRRLQKRYLTGELTHEQFKAAYAALDRQTAHALCENGDNHVASVKIGGHVLCAECALLKEGVTL